MKIDGYYINLDRATDRRARLEENLAAVRFSNQISMKRFCGIIPTEAQAAAFGKLVPGFSAGHLGCLYSHKAILAQKIAEGDDGSHLMVVEDDVLFSRKTEALLNSALAALAGHDWDLLYTDFIVEGEAQKVQLYESRRRAHSQSLINLKNVSFTGLTCYLVNQASLGKFLAVLNELEPVSKLIDWHIRESVNNGALAAYSTFPFITSLSDEADNSTIDGGIPLSHYNNFVRRHLWIEAPGCGE